MAKIWVLDSETKGTGAQMVPLEKVIRKKRRTGDRPVFVPRKPAEPRPVPAPAPRAPRLFKVVDVMTREVLAEGAGAAATIDLLKQVRSVVDVTISVWEPKHDKWRLLTLGERKALWRLRDRVGG